MAREVYDIAHPAAEPPPPLDLTIHHGQIERPKPAWRPNPEDDTDFSDSPPLEDDEGGEGSGSLEKGSRQAFGAGKGRDDQNDLAGPAEIKTPVDWAIPSLQAILEAMSDRTAGTRITMGAGSSPPGSPDAGNEGTAGTSQMTSSGLPDAGCLTR